MSFLHPGLLAAGLACVAIPILIHLLMNRRRKPVRWAAMRFLLEAYRRQQRRLLVEKWLLLATRCLIIALLAAAVARPIFGSIFDAVTGGAGRTRTLYLLVDNSLTAQLRTEPGNDGATALDRHKTSARAILNAVADARGGGGGSGGNGGGGGGGSVIPAGGVRVALITLGAPAEALVLPPSMDIESVAKLVDGIEPVESRADVGGAMTMVIEHARGGSTGAGGGAESADGRAEARTAPDALPPLVALLSDLREGSFDAVDPGEIAGAVSVGTLPAGSTLIVSSGAMDPASTNTSIDALEPLRAIAFAGEVSAGALRTVAQQVRVRLSRSEPGGGRADGLPAGTSTVRVRMTPGGANASSAQRGSAGPAQPMGATVVRWSAGQQNAEAVLTVSGELPGSADTAVLHASIDDDVLAADNARLRGMEVRGALRVGIVSPRRFEAQIRADRLEPAQWLRLAITAAGDGSDSRSADPMGGIEAVEIEPAALESARLAALDALFLPRPDLVAESAWPRLRVFVEGGGMLMVFPPAEASTHLWPDSFLRTFDLPLSAPRESVELTSPSAGDEGPPGVGLTLPESGSAAAGTTAIGAPARAEPNAEALLALIRGELPDLLAPVRAFRHLPIRPGPQAPDALARREVLRLADGSVTIWALRPGRGEGNESSPANSGLVVYCSLAMDPAWTNLPARPLMVPLMQELVRQGVGASRPATSFVAGQTPELARRTVELVPIEPAGGAGGSGTGSAGSSSSGEGSSRRAARVAVDPLTGLALAPVRSAWLFRTMDDAGAAGALVAVNANTAASRIAAQSPGAIAQPLERLFDPADVPPAANASPVRFFDATGSVAADGQANTSPTRDAGTLVREALGAGAGDSWLSWQLLAAVLGLALLEVALARSASHASIGRPGDAAVQTNADGGLRGAAA